MKTSWHDGNKCSSKVEPIHLTWEMTYELDVLSYRKSYILILSPAQAQKQYFFCRIRGSNYSWYKIAENVHKLAFMERFNEVQLAVKEGPRNHASFLHFVCIIVWMSPKKQNQCNYSHVRLQQFITAWIPNEITQIQQNVFRVLHKTQYQYLIIQENCPMALP